MHTQKYCHHRDLREDRRNVGQIPRNGVNGCYGRRSPHPKIGEPRAPDDKSSLGSAGCEILGWGLLDTGRTCASMIIEHKSWITGPKMLSMLLITRRSSWSYTRAIEDVDTKIFNAHFETKNLRGWAPGRPSERKSLEESATP